MPTKQSASYGWVDGACIGGLLAILLLLFIRSLNPALTLSAGDANLTVMSGMYRMRDFLFTGMWVAENGLGFPGAPGNVTPGILFTYLVPFYKYVDANAIFHLFLAGVGGYFLIHDMTRNRFASFMGGLFLMLQPHVLSHLLPGHVGHFLMAGWTVPLLLFARRALLDGGLNWLYAGGCAGALVAAGQHDVGAFFGILAAAYGLFLLIRTVRDRRGTAAWGKTVLGIAAAAALALLMSWQSLFANMLRQLTAHKEATTQVQNTPGETMSDEQKWYWATQWSVPPVETLDMAVPGFFGWGSSDPGNPYRGRIGQTEGWMKHRQGLPNLNDVCQYLGAVLLLGLLLALVRRKRDPETWFFFAAGALALVLAFGKFGPLYRLFYALPGMDTLRNPIKWYYITSLCAGILGALGLAEASRADGAPETRLKAALLAFLPGVLLLLAGTVTLGALGDNTFPYWQNKALLDRSGESLGLAALFWGAAGLAFFLLLSSPRGGRAPGLKAGAALAALVMAGELFFVNSHYMPYQPWSRQLNAGGFRPFLDSVKPPSRIRFLRQDGIYHFLSELTIARGLENANPYPSRLPDEYLLLQQRMEQADPVKFWRLCNVRYIVSPGPLNDPRFRLLHQLKAGPATVVVSEMTNYLDRVTLVTEWRTVPRQQAADLLMEPGFDFGREALVHADDPAAVPPPAEPGPEPATPARVRITHYEPMRLEAETDSPAPALAVFLTRHDPGWRAFVDGKPVPSWRANAVVQACPVPAGRHTLEWRFTFPDRTGFRMTLLGWGLALLAVVAGFVLRALHPGRDAA